MNHKSFSKGIQVQYKKENILKDNTTQTILGLSLLCRKRDKTQTIDEESDVEEEEKESAKSREAEELRQ